MRHVRVCCKLINYNKEADVTCLQQTEFIETGPEGVTEWLKEKF